MNRHDVHLSPPYVFTHSSSCPRALHHREERGDGESVMISEKLSYMVFHLLQTNTMGDSPKVPLLFKQKPVKISHVRNSFKSNLAQILNELLHCLAHEITPICEVLIRHRLIHEQERKWRNGNPNFYFLVLCCCLRVPFSEIPLSRELRDPELEHLVIRPPFHAVKRTDHIYHGLSHKVAAIRKKATLYSPIHEGNSRSGHRCAYFHLSTNCKMPWTFNLLDLCHGVGMQLESYKLIVLGYNSIREGYYETKRQSCSAHFKGCR